MPKQFVCQGSGVDTLLEQLGEYEKGSQQAPTAHGDKVLRVFRLPWLERPQAVDFPKTEMYSGILTGKTESHTQAVRSFFGLLNETFPCFLPARYHAMDCKALFKKSPGGHFWHNSGLFLFSNLVLGPNYYHDIKMQLENSRNPKIFRSFQGPDVWLQRLGKENIHECTTAAEFLLEPWVLVQLPFQPVLFYQWSVALLAEALRLQKDLVDFYTMAVPRKYGAAIAKLFAINQELLDFAIDGLRYFNQLSIGKVSKHFSRANKQFIDECSKVLPALQFVLGAECSELVRALKRLCWNCSAEEDRITTFADGLCFERCEVFLNRWFWENYEWREVLMKNTLRPEEDESPCSLIDKANGATEQPTNMNAVKKLVTKKIIETERLNGESRKEILETVENISPKLKIFFDLYLKYIVTSTEEGSSEDREGGIILDIINLHSDVKVAEALSLMTQRIQQQMATTGSKIFISAIDCKGPDMSYKAIVKALDKVQTSNEWSFESIVTRLKMACLAAAEKLDRNWKAPKIVHHFETRIKTLVLTMIEQQFKSVAGAFKFSVEQQYVQYFMPCLVASILHMDSDRGVSKSELRDYVDMVQEMLNAYEKEQYLLSSPKQSPFFAFRKQYLGYLQMKDIECNQVLKFKLASGPVIVVNMMQRHLFKHADIKQIVDESQPYQDMLLLTHYLMICRLRGAIKKLGWAKHNPDFTVSHIFHFGVEWDQIPALTAANIMTLYSREASTRSNTETKLKKSRDLPVTSSALMLEQILALSIYHLVKVLKQELMEEHQPELNEMIPFDDFGPVIKSLRARDWCNLKVALGQLCEGKNYSVVSLISLADAKLNDCYREALRSLTPKGKVVMKEPGEHTFFPVKHCRWCGTSSASEFLRCPDCSGGYHDVHFFCSENCKIECLDKKHREEHARFEKS